MNADFDPLEEELTALSPHAVSPGLRRRIAERLAEPPHVKIQSAKLQRRRWFALTGAIAAACLVVACLVTSVSWWGRGGGDSRRHVVGAGNVQPVAPVSHVEPGSRVESGTSERNTDWEPRLLTYQRALAHSPEELDAVLGREAVFATESRAQLVQFRAFTPSNASLNALLGDN